jgi:hypothetical protein
MRSASKFRTLAAAALLAVGSVASAATITFTTSGDTVSLGGGATLSYVGNSVSYDTADLPVLDDGVEYGTFHVTGLTSTSLPSSLIPYNITITETSPDAGSAIVLGTIQGKIKINSSTLQWNSDPGTATISFSPAADGVLAVYFTLDSTNIGYSEHNATTGIGVVNGNLDVLMTNPGPGTPVPLPAATWGGTALLGLLGTLKTLRRRAMH